MPLVFLELITVTIHPEGKMNVYNDIVVEAFHGSARGSELTKATEIHHLGTMNVYTNFCANASSRILWISKNFVGPRGKVRGLFD